MAMTPAGNIREVVDVTVRRRKCRQIGMKRPRSSLISLIGRHAGVE
jgi:hypothetical protein